MILREGKRLMERSIRLEEKGVRRRMVGGWSAVGGGIRSGSIGFGAIAPEEERSSMMPDGASPHPLTRSINARMPIRLK